jgi:hypothetical protein
LATCVVLLISENNPPSGASDNSNEKDPSAELGKKIIEKVKPLYKKWRETQRIRKERMETYGPMSSDAADLSRERIQKFKEWGLVDHNDSPGWALKRNNNGGQTNWRVMASASTTQSDIPDITVGNPDEAELTMRSLEVEFCAY